MSDGKEIEIMQGRGMGEWSMVLDNEGSTS